MATKNFTQFDLRTNLLTSDYIVGYNAAGTGEYRATVQSFVSLVSTGGGGSPGGPGTQGIQGIQGQAGSMQGLQGLQGATLQGIQGIAGSGLQGVQGTFGVQGAAGSTQGLQGLQGSRGLAGGVTIDVTNNGNTNYVINGQSNPTLVLTRGYTYHFDVFAIGHVFWIQKVPAPYNAGQIYNDGVVNNGTDFGIVSFTIPLTAPTNLYYVSQTDAGMTGSITTVNAGFVQGLQGLQGLQGMQGGFDVSTASWVQTNFLPLTGGIISGNLSVTNSLTATTISTTGSGNVLIDRGNYRYNSDPTIILGANSNQHLRFRVGGDTNNQIRMTILSSGEIGIGTTLAETASAGAGGLIVKNNLLVGGTTIKETVNLTLSSVVNGDFENITSLTAEPGGEWYSGTPIGWTSNNATPITYTVFNGAGGDRVANVSQVSDGPGLLSFRQNLGALQTLSDINVTFNYVSSSIAPWSTGTLNAAIYDGSFNALATNTYTTSGTYILSAAAVPVGTTIIVGFWSEGFTTPGLNNVTVAQVTNTALTVAGGVSASSVITSRLQVRDGVVIFTNLPTLSTGLPSGAIWNSNGFLRVV
jgi:hypothetical protein